jgi:hypothetical protein
METLEPKSTSDIKTLLHGLSHRLDPAYSLELKCLLKTHMFDT